MTFVNAHLAAFDEMLERRNADFHDICKRLIFDSPVTMEDVPTGSWYSPASTALSIFNTDALFWLVSALRSAVFRMCQRSAERSWI